MAKKQQKSVSAQRVSPTTIWLAAIASTVVAVLLYGGLHWLEFQFGGSSAYEAPPAEADFGWKELLIVSLIFGVLVLGPGILVALIVLPILLKNKKKG